MCTVDHKEFRKITKAYLKIFLLLRHIMVTFTKFLKSSASRIARFIISIFYNCFVLAVGVNRNKAKKFAFK